jgi:hypothetical protein
MKIFKIIILLLIMPISAASQTIVNHDFNNSSFSPLGAQSFWSIQPTGGVDNSPAARLTVSESGTANKALAINVGSYASNIFWVEFDVKIQNEPIGGSKFVKLFGDSLPTKNNMTVGLSPDSNPQTNNGVAYNGDTNCSDNWTGPAAYNDCGSTWVKTGAKIDLRGNVWRHYKAMVKRADPGTRNGETKIWLNGALHAHITNQDSNPGFADPTPGFYRIELGGYVREYRPDTGVGFLTGTTPTWYLWVDNVYIGTTENGTPSTVACYSDFDDDRYPGPSSQSVENCPANYYTSGYFVSMVTDCNDNNAAINPGALEVCDDGTDNNCSGSDAVCGEEPVVGAGAFWEYKDSVGKMYVPASE